MKIKLMQKGIFDLVIGNNIFNDLKLEYSAGHIRKYSNESNFIFLKDGCEITNRHDMLFEISQVVHCSKPIADCIFKYKPPEGDPMPENIMYFVNQKQNASTHED